ncbi:sugar kinase [Pseudoroseomonas cervicalis]|uniref:sugar kinase n=1 Tax=Teichococcus cervicalis TaxID=204525 RepID=UPI0035E99B13
MLLCMGEPMLELNQQPAGAEGRVHFLQGHGGDTSNAAIAAARQGCAVGYITAIGEDAPGQSFLSLWQAEGVDIAHVRRDAAAPTGLYLVTHGASGHEFQFYRSHSAASRYRAADLPLDAIRAARLFYASGISLGISESAADAVLAAIDAARQARVPVALDTNYRPRLWPRARAAALIHAAMAEAEIALPSLDDATALTGLSDPDAVLDFYLALGPRLVALKMSSAGTYLATPEGRLRIPPFPCRPVDATGAGDTFCGSFLARLLAGDAPEQAARYAACAAALSTQGYGAVAPIPDAAAVRAALG